MNTWRGLDVSGSFLIQSEQSHVVYVTSSNLKQIVNRGNQELSEGHDELLFVSTRHKFLKHTQIITVTSLRALRRDMCVVLVYFTGTIALLELNMCIKSIIQSQINNISMRSTFICQVSVCPRGFIYDWFSLSHFSTLNLNSCKGVHIPHPAAVMTSTSAQKSLIRFWWRLVLI